MKSAFLIAVLIVVAVASISYIAFGFNMTEQQKKEIAIFPLCQNLNQLWIPEINQTCWESYGDTKRLID